MKSLSRWLSAQIQIHSHRLPTRLGRVMTQHREVEQIIAHNRYLETQVAERTKALRQSEAWFRCLFEDADIGMAMLSLEGHFLRVNRSLCAMLGYSEAELLSLNVQALLTATDTSPDTSPDPGVEAQQLAAACRQPTEGCYRHKQGHPVWVRVTLSQLCDDQGQPLYYSAQIHKANSNLKCTTSKSSSDKGS